MSDTTWTEIEITTLKQLCADGQTAAQIADQLPGRNRNMVVGKLTRLRRRDPLSPRLCDTDKQNTTERAKAKAKATARVKLTWERLPYAPYTPPTDAEREDDIRASRITVLDLRENMCRYAIDAPAGEKLSFFFCGEETAVDRSWCAHHFKMTHNQNAQRRV